MNFFSFGSIATKVSFFQNRFFKKFDFRSSQNLDALFWSSENFSEGIFWVDFEKFVHRKNRFKNSFNKF